MLPGFKPEGGELEEAADVYLSCTAESGIIVLHAQSYCTSQPKRKTNLNPYQLEDCHCKMAGILRKQFDRLANILRIII